MSNQDYDIKIGRTEITVPHGDKRIIFIHPSKGPDNYVNVMEQILNDGLKLPTGEYTASLVHAAYCGPEEVNKNSFKFSFPVSSIRDVMKNNRIWVPNKNLWIPANQQNSGVFVVYDEKGVGLTKPLDQGELEKALEDGEEITINGTKIKVSKDRKIRFASRDTYEGGFQSHEDFAKNGFVVASYLEGANKLSEVSKTFNNSPRVWILDPINPEQRVSAVGGYVGGLWFDGNGFGGYGRGLAFGVLK